MSTALLPITTVEHDLGSVIYRDRGADGAVMQKKGFASIIGALDAVAEQTLLRILLEKYPVSSFTNTLDQAWTNQLVKKRSGRPTKQAAAAKAAAKKAAAEQAARYDPRDLLPKSSSAGEAFAVDPFTSEGSPAKTAAVPRLLVAIDIHGTLTTYPKQFKALAAWANRHGDVVFLPGLNNKNPAAVDFEVERYRKEKLLHHGLAEYAVHVCIGDNSTETARLKAEYCRDNDVDILFDDSEDVCMAVHDISPKTLCLRVM